MDLGLHGRTALVTGASSGIGAATARMFAEEGADVIVAYGHNLTGAEEVASAIRGLGRRAWIECMDVSDPQSVADSTNRIRESVGGLDAVAMCAGMNVITQFENVTPEEWDQVVRVNLNGTFYVMREVTPLLRDGAGIVTVASVAANTGAPHHPHYAAAKAGVVALTKSAARALAPRVRVNCVSPGLTMTAMGRDTMEGLQAGYAESRLLARRVAAPDEIARCIVFVASPAASFMYGACLDVNGGRDLR